VAESFARPHSLPRAPGSTPCPGRLPSPFSLLPCQIPWIVICRPPSTSQCTKQRGRLPLHGGVMQSLCTVCVCLRSGSSERNRTTLAPVFAPSSRSARARSLFIFPRPRTRQRGRAARPTASSLPPSHPTARFFLFASLAHFRFPCCRGPGVGRLSHWTIPPPDPDDRQAWGTEPLAISTRYMTIIALPN